MVYLVIGPLPRTFKDRQLEELSLRSILALRIAPTASRGFSASSILKQVRSKTAGKQEKQMVEDKKALLLFVCIMGSTAYG